MNSIEPPAAATPTRIARRPIERYLLWAALACVAVWHRGPTFVDNLKPAEGRLYDFFQEWASARNYFDGLPIYTEQHKALERLTGTRPNRDASMLPYNAHPPASVLLALPFAGLRYRDAHFAWNLTMLLLFAATVALIVRGLRLPFHVGSLLPTIVLVLYCFPLDHQIAQGQLNLVLLFLITLCWTFDRNDWPWLAGMTLGLAAGLKLFPAFLFLYFLMRANWIALVAGGIGFVSISAAALLLFGQDAFSDYFRVVLPSLEHYRSSWSNLSLTGFWLRTCNPGHGERVIPLAHSPLGAWVGMCSTTALVTLLVAWGCRGLRKRTDPDWAFALGLVGMLLVSPITWNHYFLFLCLPFALIWRDSTSWQRWVFRLLLILMWIPPGIYHLIGMGKTAASKWETARHELPFLTPMQNLLVASFLTYCLLGLFVLVLRFTLRTHTKPIDAVASPCP
jgi:Glycosyltransferase family 87